MRGLPFKPQCCPDTATRPSSIGDDTESTAFRATMETPERAEIISKVQLLFANAWLKDKSVRRFRVRGLRKSGWNRWAALTYKIQQGPPARRKQLTRRLKLVRIPQTLNGG